MKLGNRLPDATWNLLSELRMMCLSLKVTDTEAKLREFVSEFIVAIRLHELGIKCELRQRCPHCGEWNMPRNTDMKAYKPFVKNPIMIPVQVKPEISASQIDIDMKPLTEFKGWYIVYIEKPEKESIFLYIRDNEMRNLMRDSGRNGSFGKVLGSHKNRLRMTIPRNVEGTDFERYLDPEEFVKAVLEDPYEPSRAGDAA